MAIIVRSELKMAEERVAVKGKDIRDGLTPANTECIAIE